MTTQYPKRTHKKNRNRELFIDSAARLFATKGYKFTTLEEVASAAGLHVQTLYRHFKNKDELATATAKFALDHCREFFEKPLDNRSTFQIWREYIVKSVLGLTVMGIGEHKRQQLLAASSMMNDNFLLILQSGYEDLLTEYLARDFQMDAKTERLPRLVACTLSSGNEAAMKRCAGLDTGEDVLDDGEAVLAESLKVVDEVESIFAAYIKTSSSARPVQ